jgi:hypothetical protein
MLGTKQLFSPLDSQILYYIHVLAATVVTLVRVALSIFISQKRTLSLKHRPTNIVLGGDKVYGFPLPFSLHIKGMANFRISLT